VGLGLCENSSTFFFGEIGQRRAALSSSLTRSHRGPYRHSECPRVMARLQRSAGSVLLLLWSWSSRLFRGQPGHRLQLGSGRQPSDRSVAPQGLVGRCVLWKSGYMSKQRAAMTDDWIQHRTETWQRENVCIPHMVLPTNLGCLALAFQLLYVGSK